MRNSCLLFLIIILTFVILIEEETPNPILTQFAYLYTC